MLTKISRKIKIILVSLLGLFGFIFILICILYILYFTKLYPPHITILLDKLPLINFTSREYRMAGEELFLKYHHFKIAKIHLQKSIELKPDNEKSLFLLGRIAFVEGDLKLSIDCFQKAIDIDPLDTSSYYGLGLSYGYLQDYRNAEKSFLKFFEIIEILKKIDLEYKEHRGLWAGYNDLAWIYFLEGDYVNAEKITDEALSKYTNPWLLTMKGAILLNKGQKKEAELYLKNAEEYAKSMTAEQFGEAYTGDDPSFHQKGLDKMKAIINENLSKTN